jgi:hypothetical protein
VLDETRVRIVRDGGFRRPGVIVARDVDDCLPAQPLEPELADDLRVDHGRGDEPG